MKGNGWNDIGYNFSSTSTARSSRAGTAVIDRNVVGAHAQGFNTGSVGVALIGNYGSTAVDRRRRAAALVEAARLAARRRARRPALEAVTCASRAATHVPGGRAGHPARDLGHRDTGFDRAARARPSTRSSPTIARAVAATGLPKLYAPAGDGRARRAGPLHGAALRRVPWTVTVARRGRRRRRDAASGTGTTRRLDVGRAAARRAGSLHAGRSTRRRPAVRPARSAAVTGRRRLGAAVVSPRRAAAGDHAERRRARRRDDDRATRSALPRDRDGDAGERRRRRRWRRSSPSRRPAGSRRSTLGCRRRSRTAATAIVLRRTPTRDERDGDASPLSRSTARCRLHGLARRVFSPNGDGRADRLRVRSARSAADVAADRAARRDRRRDAPRGRCSAGAARVDWDGRRRGRAAPTAVRGRRRRRDLARRRCSQHARSSSTRRAGAPARLAAPRLVRSDEPATVTRSSTGSGATLRGARRGAFRVPGARARAAAAPRRRPRRSGQSRPSRSRPRAVQRVVAPLEAASSISTRARPGRRSRPARATASRPRRAPAAARRRPR